MTLFVGIPACSIVVGNEPRHATPARYGAAVMAAAGAVPVLLPPVGEAMLAVLDRLDGLLLSGSPSNVAPDRYGVPEDETPGQHDPARDATTLPLARAALARGMPLLAICRGVQELNVALGGTLHQRVHTLPGRMDHRHEPGPMAHMFRPRHMVRLSGRLARIVGAEEAIVNSLHGQALDRLGEGLVAEAMAPDGTVEAVRVAAARGWAFGVQFHPEWDAETGAASGAIFRAFGEACRCYAEAGRVAT